MNQILDYNPNKNSGGGSSGSDKVVRVFAVMLILFAICLLAVGAYGFFNKNAEKNESQPVAPSKAKITVEQTETEAVIKVEHDKNIEKIIYSWDTEKEVTYKGNGESTMEVKVPLIAGKHTLNIKVVDSDNVESKDEKEIISESGEDKIYPVINLEVTPEKKLKIIATDETAIDFVTYRWNDQEEQRIEVSDDDKKIEFDIEILKGKNDLIIVAVDKNSNNTTEQKTFSGVTKPDVKITVAADKKSADIICTHENGLKTVKLKVNEKDYDVDIGNDNPKEVTVPAPLVEGNCTVTVTATSIDDTETVVTEEIEGEVNEDEVTISIEKKENSVDEATIKASCAGGIKEVRLNINDVDYSVDIGVDNPPEISVDVPLPLEEGNNKIAFTVITVNGTEKTETKEISR